MKLDKFSQIVTIFQNKEIEKNIVNNLKEIILSYFDDKPLFDKKQISFYFFDDNQTKTTVSKKTYLNLFVEINSPNNFKNEKLIKKKSKLDTNIKPVHLSLKEIKIGLKDLLISILDADSQILQETYSILLINKLINEETGKKELFYINIVPCFTYVNENKVSGIIYYDDSEKLVQINYPKLALKNFKEKNKLTNNLYKEYVVAFKNIFKSQKNINVLPFEIYETLLYNIPNELFVNYSFENLVKIINHMRNMNLKEFSSMDSQDQVFMCKYRSLSILYSKHVIRTIEKFIKANQ